ncbi:MAG: FGGY family carbohydrate kinase, partial [Gammaproteobacteria bacterium]
MAHLLALDQGTTSSRALLFDPEGNPVAIAQREFAQHYPQAGWVEHNPNDIWDTQFQTAIEAIKTAGITAGDVAAIGITNQRETCLLWDRQTGTACGPAIVWQDRRTSAMCDSLLEQGYEDFVQTRSGLLLDPYFSASKLRWMLDQDPDLRRRAEAGELAFGTIDSWLVWKLSEGRAHITDATNASRTGLCNLQTSSWDTELLELWGVPQAVLPVIVDSSGICTTTTLLGPEIPIAGIAGDQQAALFGQACYEPGMAKCTYGTGCFLLMQTGTTAVRSNHRLLTTI